MIKLTYYKIANRIRKKREKTVFLFIILFLAHNKLNHSGQDVTGTILLIESILLFSTQVLKFVLYKLIKANFMKIILYYVYMYIHI